MKENTTKTVYAEIKQQQLTHNRIYNIRYYISLYAIRNITASTTPLAVPNFVCIVRICHNRISLLNHFRPCRNVSDVGIYLVLLVSKKFVIFVFLRKKETERANQQQFI